MLPLQSQIVLEVHSYSHDPALFVGFSLQEIPDMVILS